MSTRVSSRALGVRLWSTGLAPLLISLLGPAAGQAQRVETPAFDRPVGRPSILEMEPLAQRPSGADTIAGQRTSRLGERFLWGFGTGFVAFGIASQATGLRHGEWAAASYVFGSAMGVVLVTRRHEGARPFRALLGAVAGAAVPILLVQLAGPEHADSPPPVALVAGSLFVVGVPLAAAVAHSIGR